MSFADAATLPVAGGTAYDAIGQLALNEGESLLINGIGGDAEFTLVTAKTATLVTYGDGVADRVREIMPDGVDAILDMIGGDALRSVADLVSDRSRLMTTADPGTAAELDGVNVLRDGTGAVLAEIAALVADGKLDPHVTDVLPLEQAAQALASVETGHARGKVVVSVP